MANIEGEANHVITTLASGETYTGPVLDLGVDAVNTIVRALSSAQLSAVQSIEAAQESGDFEQFQDGMRGLIEVENVLTHLYQINADAGNEIPNEEGVRQTGVAFNPLQLGTIVSTLAAYGHKTTAALAAIKRGEFTVVDKKPEEIENGEVPLENYNTVVADNIVARDIAVAVASYLRSAYPEVVSRSHSAFIEQTKDRIEFLRNKQLGDGRTALAAMLDTGSVMLGVDPGILEAELEFAAAGIAN